MSQTHSLKSHKTFWPYLSCLWIDLRYGHLEFDKEPQMLFQVVARVKVLGISGEFWILRDFGKLKFCPFLFSTLYPSSLLRRIRKHWISAIDDQKSEVIIKNSSEEMDCYSVKFYQKGTTGKQCVLLMLIDWLYPNLLPCYKMSTKTS